MGTFKIEEDEDGAMTEFEAEESLAVTIYDNSNSACVTVSDGGEAIIASLSDASMRQLRRFLEFRYPSSEDPPHEPDPWGPNAQWNAVESGIISWEIPSSPLTETADGKVTPASELPGGEETNHVAPGSLLVWPGGYRIIPEGEA